MEENRIGGLTPRVINSHPHLFSHPQASHQIMNQHGRAPSSNQLIKPRTMASGFVSGGTTDAPIERSDEWLAAQKELEASRQRKAEQARQADGRSLYETLEANKGTTMNCISLVACSFRSWTDHAGVL